MSEISKKKTENGTILGGGQKTEDLKNMYIRIF